ncbi:peptidase A24 [Microbacterium sp. Root53]|uniref:prepilin peptidase n=1 Tax=Microbacterium sp. Root53 TaxID=1736553 RepID=UPI0006F7C05A|nr:A24 family peptidase [Microbacterium sp. Root53]KQZ04920.1 peptidase A24 [Microbacterium sp. Root53]
MIAVVTTGVGLFGLAIGSFLNVVAHRVPLGQSVVAPRSACPACGHEIRAYDNVPVLSWLILRGRCRDCAAPISARYPIVEAVTAALFVVVAAAFAPSIAAATTAAGAWAASLVLVAHLALAGFGVALAAIDLDTQRLPDALVLPLLGTGVALFTAAAALTGAWGDLLRAGIGAASLGLVYFAIFLISPRAMGFGDVKLALPLGMFLAWHGWGALVVGAIGAFALGAAVGGALILARRVDRRGGIPFGPWMIAGAWLGILAGEVLARAYLQLFGLA